MHPSLLPRYRGPAPIHHTLLNGDTKTGVSLIKLSLDKFDHGDVLAQVSRDVHPEENFLELSAGLGQLGAEVSSMVSEGSATVT